MIIISSQLEEAVAEGQYEVEWSVLVDRPERRDASYRPVRAGASMQHRRVFDNRNKALSFAKGLLAGEDDSESDFVRYVSVIRLDAPPRSRWVMKMVERERGADGKVALRKAV